MEGMLIPNLNQEDFKYKVKAFYIDRMLTIDSFDTEEEAQKLRQYYIDRGHNPDHILILKVPVKDVW